MILKVTEEIGYDTTVHEYATMEDALASIHETKDENDITLYEITAKFKPKRDVKFTADQLELEGL